MRCARGRSFSPVPWVVWAAADPKAGAAGSVMNVLAEPKLNHRPDAAGGLLAEEAAEPDPGLLHVPALTLAL